MSSHPALLAAEAETLAALLATDRFRRVFPDARLLTSVADAAEATELQQTLPAALLPFMRTQGGSWPDIYAFDGDGPQARVVVWSGHAVVMDWPSFPAFIEWVNERIDQHVHPD